MMRFLKTLTLIICPALLNSCTLITKERPPPQTANYINTDKFVGKWYKIAGTPTFNTDGCTCTIGKYEKISKPNTFKVTNSCYKTYSKKWLHVKGEADIVKNSRNTKLKVTFLWPFYTNYWILYISKNYDATIIARPDYSYILLFSRTPVISKEKFNELISIAKQRGYDTNLLKKIKQNCHYS